ncbi:HlyD family type I secretion periplasmic adaptor subunit [Seohaeicola saemankumensis]|uniref:HlyD family type I secretion periplasmic adaptor subunit n=1 Tax=Seohaeicola saemankumensis TaxID=481181 RepID=UPI0035D0C370
MRTPPALGHSDSTDPNLDDFSPEVVELEARPLPRSVRLSLISLFCVICFGIGWSLFATLDRVVEAEGILISQQPRQIIQPFGTSVIAQMNFRAGDSFRQGDVLVTFDKDLADADFNILSASVAALRLEHNRLLAEVDIPATKAATATVPTAASWAGTLQEEIFRMRMSEMAARLSSDAIRTSELEQTVTVLQNRLSILDAQIEINAQELAVMRQQAGAGNITRDKPFELQNLLAGLQNERIRLHGEIKQAEARINIIATEQRGFVAAWQVATRERLSDIEKELGQQEEQLRKISYIGARDVIVAGFDGVVLDTVERSPGSVVQASDTLMVAMPVISDNDLRIEATIQPRDVGWVSIGQEVRIKLSALPSSKHGYLKGTVTSISADAIQGEGRMRSNVPRAAEALRSSIGHRALITVAHNNLRNLPSGFRLLPGMLLRAEILVGTRHPYQYFLDPFLSGANRALSEPN